jgi:phenylalanyl-tRNA synthetase beta chain
VALGPSPLGVQARLTAAGMRPLSNVVDATNYAMLEVGQPLHPFDLDLLHGRGIVVRRAEEGERLVTLDDVERELTSDDLLIADLAKAVAIAGVIGSAAAEVHPGTTDVLLESAWFERKGIFRTARRLGVQTEASARFSRGTDPENPPRGADRAARLMVEWSGGSVSAGAIDVGEAPERRKVALRPSRASALLGYEVTRSDASEVFERLGVGVRKARGDEVEIEVPGYRVDLEREIDLIEEVVRVQGYESLGSKLPGIRQAGGVAETYSSRRQARDALVRAGLREAISLSFASRSDLELMGQPGVRLANPVSSEEGTLRTSLIPGLLRAAARNASRGVSSVALFEVGHVFRPNGTEGEPVDEREFAAGLVAGPAGLGYHQERRDFDLFDAKGVLEALLDGLSVIGWRLGDPPGKPFHPARSAVVLVDGEIVGSVGEVHPRVAEKLDLPKPPALFEVDLSGLALRSGRPFEYREIPRFPPVRRDLAFVVDEGVPAGAVGEALAAATGGVADGVVLFDVFRGPPIPEGRKSLAFSVDFRMPDRTLTDDDVDAVVRTIVTRLHGEFGAELRAG